MLAAPRLLRSDGPLAGMLSAILPAALQLGLETIEKAEKYVSASLVWTARDGLKAVFAAEGSLPGGDRRAPIPYATSCVWTPWTIAAKVRPSTSCDLVHDPAIRPTSAEELCAGNDRCRHDACAFVAVRWACQRSRAFGDGSF